MEPGRAAVPLQDARALARDAHTALTLRGEDAVFPGAGSALRADALESRAAGPGRAKVGPGAALEVAEPGLDAQQGDPTSGTEDPTAGKDLRGAAVLEVPRARGSEEVGPKAGSGSREAAG